MSKICVNKKDIEEVVQVLEKFPEVNSFQLREHSQSGIGSCLDMIFETEVNGIRCQLTVPIADEASW